MNSKAKGVVALILAVAVLANVGIFAKMSYNKTHTAQETIVFRVGDTVASDHPISQALYIFEEELERISNGRFDVRVYINSALGGDRQQTESVVLGYLQGNTPPTSVLAGFDTRFMVVDLPFVFKSGEAAMKTLNGDLGEELNPILNDLGLHAMGWTESGYRHITTNNIEATTPAALKGLSIRTQENLVKLHKRGRMLVASYEAIRFQRLDLFSVTLRQIGAYIARMHLDDAVQVLMNGDGNNNAADAYEIGSGSGKISGTAGTLTYSALLEFWSKFDPYSMNTMLVSNDVMLQMLKLSEFQNPLTGLNFQGTGTLSTPLGAKLLRTSAVPAGKLIGLDKNYALEHICGSEVMVEYDKLIDRQIERAAITSISGFAKPYQEASKVLTV